MTEPGIGHNNPPLTPFEQSRDEITGLFDEATHWVDEPVTTQADADGIARLLAMLRAAVATADERRKVEVAPFDEGKAEVQARYNPLIADTKTQRGKAQLAMDACKRALAPWLAKIEAEKQAEADRLRREADAAREAATAAIRETADDLAGREWAESQLANAKQIEAAAGRAARDHARADTGGARAVGLRTEYVPVLIDAPAAARHYWKVQRAAVEAHLVTLAERDVRQGKRTIPGFRVDEIKTVV